MSAPRDQTDSELLSAYLDGELTADEHAQVERLLAENPAMVQLLDELRAIGSMLRAMPRYTLGEDISGQVLRLGQRQRPAGPGSKSLRRDFRRPPVYIALTVVVAAVLLAVIVPWWGDRAERDGLAVAPGPADEKSAAPPQTAPAPKSGRLLHGNSTDSAAPDSAASDSAASDSAAPDSAASVEPTPPGAPGLDAPAPGDPALRSKGGVAPASPPVVNGPAANSKPIPPPKGASPGPDDVIARYDMIVQFEISPEADRQGTFDELLAKHGLVRSKSRAARSRAGSSAGVGGSMQPTRPGTRKLAAKDAPDEAAAVAGKGEPIYIEGTAAQIEALLAALKSRPEALRRITPPPEKTKRPDDGKAMLRVLVERRVAGSKPPVAAERAPQQPVEEP